MPQRLTAGFIKNLKPKSNRFIITDNKTPGLAVVINPNGSKYYYRYRPSGSKKLSRNLSETYYQPDTTQHSFSTEEIIKTLTNHFIYPKVINTRRRWRYDIKPKRRCERIDYSQSPPCLEQ